MRTARSRAELRRAGVMARVEAGELKLVDAAALIPVCYRQAIRIWKRYRAEGAAGLKHRNAGRPSNRAKPRRFREKVLRLVRTKYGGEEGERLGPTLAAEHLAADDRLTVDAETLRRGMLAAGLWHRGRKRQQHRRRRERKKHFGELVQLDGSFPAWLEKRGPQLCLMNMVDDATGTTLSRLHEQETIWAAVDVLRAWVEKYGVPQALYTDWKNVYVREPTEEERLTGKVPWTQLERMCARLGTRIWAASSPQAKGRVERNHGTQQDRLIKKLRLRQIRTWEEANRYLRQSYLPDHHRRFRREPAEREDYHRRSPSPAELDSMFRLEEERTMSNDWVVRYQGRFLQIERESRYAPAGSKVMVSEGRDGRLQVRYRGRAVSFHEIPAPAAPQQLETTMQERALQIRKKLYRPPSNHPWRKWSPLWPRNSVAGSAARPGP